MTDQVQIALIASIGPTIIGILNAVHQFTASKKVEQMGENIKQVEVQTNHIKDALVAATALASHAEGVKDEKLRAADAANRNAGGQPTAPGVG